MKWCSVTEFGEITSIGDCPDGTSKDAFNHVGGVIHFEIPEFVGNDTHYVKNGCFLAFPQKPNNYCHWNWEDEVWEYNLSLAIESTEFEIKAKRGLLLKQSDWTQLPDVPLSTKETWAEYRQYLRDIPSQAGYPFEVTWPVPPN